MNLWGALRSRAAESRDGLPIGGPDAYVALVNQMYGNGLGVGGGGLQQTLTGAVEKVGTDYAGLINGGYASNGVVFACMAVRQQVFSGVRFAYQRLRAGRPSDMYGDLTLTSLERPWAGGTTQDLLARMIQDADLAGNSYWTRDAGELVRLRPDWVEIVLEPRIIRSRQVSWRRVGYLYYEGGKTQGNEPAQFLLGEVAHFAPLPDPAAMWRGMSWLTPVVREIQADGLMGQHKRRFFENGATPNMVIRHGPTATPQSVARFKAALDADHAGVDNAYRTLHVGGGADVTLVGTNFQQMDFTAVQGHGETRIAAAAGVPPIIVGLSEGLASATYSNYAQARRRLADGTMHPLWGNAAGTMGWIMPTPPGTRLWYDSRDVPFLREDETDAATIAEIRARTIRTYVDGGYTPASAMAAVDSGDIGLLQHTGLFSVQLQSPTADAAGGAAAPVDQTWQKSGLPDLVAAGLVSPAWAAEQVGAPTTGLSTEPVIDAADTVTPAIPARDPAAPPAPPPDPPPDPPAPPDPTYQGGRSG